MDLRNDDNTYLLPGFPIRKSADHWLFAPTRSLSQLVTSFIVSQCQGILPALLVAWPDLSFSCFAWFSVISFPSKIELIYPESIIFLLKTLPSIFSFSFCLLIFSSFQYSVFKVQSSFIKLLFTKDSGDNEIRTHDPLLARQVLSQLSYTPTPWFIGVMNQEN